MIRAQLQNLTAYRKPKTVGTAGNLTVQNPGAFKPPSLPKPPSSSSAGEAAPALDPLRPDSIYEQALSNIRTGLGSTEASLTADEGALGTDYGVAFDRDEQGQATNFRLDYTNPFSKASLFQKAFDQQNRANTNSYAARGQLYSGALQNAKDSAVFNNQQGQNEVLTGFGSGARQIFQARVNARNQANQDITTAADSLLGRNIAAGPPPAPGPANGLEMLKAAAPNGDLNKLRWTNKGIERWNGIRWEKI